MRCLKVLKKIIVVQIEIASPELDFLVLVSWRKLN